LAPGASTTFSVTFTPAAAGIRNAAIHIVSNDADETPFDINMRANFIAEAIDQPAIGVANGDTPWDLSTWDMFDGVDAAQSGVTYGTGTSSFSITVAGPGTVSFWWKLTKAVDYGSGYAYGDLSLLVDGVVQRSLGSSYFSYTWVQESVTLDSGTHVLTWVHDQPSNPYWGFVGAWVDQVVLPAAPTPCQTFETWAFIAELTGQTAAPLAIPHGDGVENLLKYAFHLDGNVPDRRVLVPATGTTGLPCIALDRSGAQPVLRFEYLRRKNSGLTYTPRKSNDLTNWLPLTGTPAVSDVVSQPEWERVIIAEPIDAATTPRCYGRVEVGMPAP